MEDQASDADLFHQGTNAPALGSLLAQGWDILKDPFGWSLGIFDRIFPPKLL